LYDQDVQPCIFNRADGTSKPVEIQLPSFLALEKFPNLSVIQVSYLLRHESSSMLEDSEDFFGIEASMTIDYKVEESILEWDDALFLCLHHADAERLQPLLG
jgi:hypothetical protein